MKKLLPNQPTALSFRTKAFAQQEKVPKYKYQSQNCNFLLKKLQTP